MVDAAAAARAKYRRMKIKQRTIIAGIAVTIMVGLATVLCQQDHRRIIKTVSPEEVHQLSLTDSAVVLLDVRTDLEYHGEHVANTILIPVQELESRIAELDSVKSKKIIAICRSGNRSNRAAAILMDQGFEAYNMLGGMLKWKAEGYPIIRGEEQ